MITVLRTLVRLSIEPTGSAWVAEARDVLRATQPAHWEDIEEILEHHRIVSLIARAIATHDLSEDVCAAFRSRLEQAYRKTLLTNTVLMRTTARVITVLRGCGIEPVVWKGAFLADSVYPDPGCRWMGDVDLVVQPSEKDQAAEALASIDFRSAVAGADATVYQNPMGVILDVHHRIRLFEKREALTSTIDVTPRHIALPTIRVLDPTTMMALLVYHMNGHRSHEGLVLRWLLDIAFVMRHWGESIDLERFHHLLPSGRHRLLFLRTAGFLESEFHVTFPGALAAAAAEVPPLRLAEVLRHRRLSQWDLATLRGWLSLAACRLGVRPRRGRTFPWFTDILIRPHDALTERAALKRLAQSSGGRPPAAHDGHPGTTSS
jgi:hypothetical protein